MAEQFLYDMLEGAASLGFLTENIPDYVAGNLNPAFEFRPYQREAFVRFFHCFEKNYKNKKWPLHFLYNMATGSGKTLIMAGLILYLYEKGYRNFLFFVNSTNIIEKTKDNFLNPLSSKYLFREDMYMPSGKVSINQVMNFEGVCPDDINICFTTVQKLHGDLMNQKENSITYEDFRDKKTVLIADEAHHINVSTKRTKEIEQLTWEDTVYGIFKENAANLLLEFTATVDYSNKNITDKYVNKIIYRYDLKRFRNELYSKDVSIVQSDLADRERILQAIILSQYKQEVAAKHRINLKPVILFKAQKTIAQSLENKTNFHKLIDSLNADDIDGIRNGSGVEIIKRGFSFFDQNKITSSQLVERLKSGFSPSNCLSVNEDKEKEQRQLELNSLEDKDNQIRAIFAVNKLNEGWDVLNLFDIVRCYQGRDGKNNKPGKSTLAEAQLIGRGARYFPFTIEGDNKFKRKFDKELNNELRILEELHYHSVNDSRYISELRTALIEQGMIDNDTVVRDLVIKDTFKKEDLYKNGVIYTNKKRKKDYRKIKSLEDMGVSRKNLIFNLSSGAGRTDIVFAEAKQQNGKSMTGHNVKLSDIPLNIIRKAVAGKGFFVFSNLKRYFTNIHSMDEFTGADHLGSLEITFQGGKKAVDHIPLCDYLNAVSLLLDEVESQIKENITEYEGSREFIENYIETVFVDKSIKLRAGEERAEGDVEFLQDKNWYVFNANHGTSEEKAFVRMFDRQIKELEKKYDEIFLIRNELHFKLYNFADGRGFEPDFVLFLRERTGNYITYQMFIEPKGTQLRGSDKWKEDFLGQIQTEYEGKVIDWIANKGRRKYRILGVPFYNNSDENAFRKAFDEALDSDFNAD
jgi:type III restriction enzyme